MRSNARIVSVSLAASVVVAQAAGIWLDVPFVKQVENGCGAAALSMTMQYWMRHGAQLNAGVADPARIQSQLYLVEERGISASSMQRYLDDHGFQALVFRGRWEDLGAQLAKGRPLIVATRAGGESHYVVVAGISQDAIEMNDPADRKLRRISRAEFEKKWRAAGNWTLLAVPRAAS